MILWLIMLHIWIAVTHLNSKLLFWTRLLITDDDIYQGPHSRTGSKCKQFSFCFFKKELFCKNGLTQSHCGAEQRELVWVFSCVLRSSVGGWLITGGGWHSCHAHMQVWMEQVPHGCAAQPHPRLAGVAAAPWHRLSLRSCVWTFAKRLPTFRFLLQGVSETPQICSESGVSRCCLLLPPAASACTDL